MFPILFRHLYQFWKQNKQGKKPLSSLLMVSYEQMNSNNETSLKYDLMHDYEFARLLKEPGVKVMDAYVHLVFDMDVISSEEIIFDTN